MRREDPPPVRGRDRPGRRVHRRRVRRSDDHRCRGHDRARRRPRQQQPRRRLRLRRPPRHDLAASDEPRRRRSLPPPAIRRNHRTCPFPRPEWPMGEAGADGRSRHRRRGRRRRLRRARCRGAGAVRGRGAGGRDRLRAIPPARRSRPRQRLVLRGQELHLGADRDARRRRHSHARRAPGVPRVAGAGRPTAGHHRAPDAADVERSRVDRGVRPGQPRRADVRRAGRRRADGGAAARVGAGLDVRVLDRHVGAARRSRRRRAGQLRGRDGLPRGAPVRPDRDHVGEPRDRRRRVLVRRLRCRHDDPRLRPLRPALPARRAVGRSPADLHVVDRRDTPPGARRTRSTACTGGCSCRACSPPRACSASASSSSRRSTSSSPPTRPRAAIPTRWSAPSSAPSASSGNWASSSRQVRRRSRPGAGLARFPPRSWGVRARRSPPRGRRRTSGRGVR